MRKMVASLGLLAALAGAAVPARAFEQTVPVPAPEKPSQAVPGLRNVPALPGISTLPHGGPGSALAPDLGGDESRGIKIPGFGSFNFLPKMDFGLELLYGEAPKASSPIDPLHDQDVTIRGTVKRRF